MMARRWARALLAVVRVALVVCAGLLAAYGLRLLLLGVTLHWHLGGGAAPHWLP